MGYYIQTPGHKRKAEQLVSLHCGQIIPKPASFNDVPADKALIAVVDNGPFEAAALAYSESKFAAFTDPRDSRPQKFVLLDKALAHQLAGYEE